MPNHRFVLLVPVLLLSLFSRAAEEPGEELVARIVAAGIPIPEIAPYRLEEGSSEEGSSEEGRGPFKRLLIKDAMLIDGRGTPPQGPVSIIIEQDRIREITSYPVKTEEGDEVIDASGMFALPGFIDAHTHLGNPGQGLAGPITPPEYIFKLWMGHGITTVRDVGSIMGLNWTLEHKKLSAVGKITAPRIVAYSMFPGTTITNEKDAIRWVRAVKKKGADGIKLRGGTEEAINAVYKETRRLEMGTANHHDQMGVYHVNALDSARSGLDSMEHWYGLPEALFENRTIQNYPPDYNYSDEQWRFGQAGRLWRQAAHPGSQKWNAVMHELIGLDFTLVPTFTIYEANRDVARARDAEWHKDYTLPALQKFFMPDPRLHGSYHFDWTTADEIAWRDNFRIWMQFINDYKNAGGRIAAGSDAGFIFKLYGFAYIRELELLQEAGFHPLEVIQSATLNGAELLGMQKEIGSLVPGKKADIALVRGNPVSNFKLLYGTGHMRLNRDSGELERAGGVSYTVKDGVVFDAKALLKDVRLMVSRARESKQ